LPEVELTHPGECCASRIKQEPHPDPYRPRVRLLFDSAGAAFTRVRELNLWQTNAEEPRSIQAPVDPAAYDIDPLTYLTK